jgi:ribosome-associated heat shock protein Hsp15
LFPVAETPASVPDSRLDLWLWAVRLFKTRALATEACRAGEVEVGSLPAKPGRVVHAGELVRVRLGSMTRTLRVIATPRSRVGAKQVPEYCADLTPAAEFEKLRADRLQRVLARPEGSGRPTKRERREVDRLFE